MNVKALNAENNKRLQELTDKFLEEFLQIASEDEGKERSKDRDSFHFGYTLPEVISNTKYAQKDYYDYPFIGSGFTKNIVESFFANNIQGFDKDILNLIENFDNQDKDYDYHAKNLVVEEDKKQVKKFKSSSSEDGKLKLELGDAEIITETVTFDLINPKSGFEGQIKIFKDEQEIFEGNVHKGKGLRIKKIAFYNSKKDLVLTLDYDLDMYATPTVHHFKYCADINSFHHTLTGIQFKKKKKQS